MDKKETPVSSWLEAKFVEWRGGRVRHAGVTQFAEHLGISRDNLNAYMLKGVVPQGENLEKIAARLGPEICDLLGLVRPVTLDEPAGELDPAEAAERAEWAHLIDGVPDDVVEMWIASIRAMREKMRNAGKVPAGGAGKKK